MKQTNVVPIKSKTTVWKGMLGVLVLFCLFAISACGGNNGYTTRVYDSAHVLNTSQVQSAAKNMRSNVDIYTTNTFNGTQSDFQRATAAKLGNDPNRVVMGIDSVHHYVYVAKGANVPLNNAAISQTVNSFAANYGNGNYTKGTTAALSTMNQALPAPSNGGGGALWAIPLGLLALLGVLFFAFKPKQHVGYVQPNTLNTRGPSYQPPPTSYRPPQTDYPPTQGARDVTPPAAGDASGYRRDKYQTDASHQSDISGGGGTFGSGGSEYGGNEYGGGGRFGKGGSDFGGDERGGGGSFGSGGSDFEKGKPGGRRNS